MTDEQRDILALLGVPGVGARTYARLVAAFGSPGAVFCAGDGDLLALDGVGPALVGALRGFDRDGFVDDQERRMDDCGAVAVARGSTDYPPLLDAFVSAPPLLFVRGDPGALAEHPTVAFVGTRGPTGYGVRMAHALAGGVARAGVCVVSGMAAGIDSESHTAAIDSGGTTVAVFGCGVDVITPRGNRDLADRIASSGCLVSHFTMGTEPTRGTFPARNAVIVGLSLGTVVVEAGGDSGALITADLTARAGRPLFAVPGDATAETSRGSNSLFRRGASPAMDPEDILLPLGLKKRRSRPVRGDENEPPPRPMKAPVTPSALPPGLAGDILRALGDGPVQLDMLSVRLKKPVHELLRELTMLELDGRVTQRPGKIFELA